MMHMKLIYATGSTFSLTLLCSRGLALAALAPCGSLAGLLGAVKTSRIQAQAPTNSFADVVPNGSFETAKSKAKPMAWIECGMGASAFFGWIGGMVPKQRNPSRLQAQGAMNSFADVVPNGSFETAKSKAKPMAWIECGMGASAFFGWIGLKRSKVYGVDLSVGWELRHSLVGLEAWFRNSGTPAGFKSPRGHEFVRRRGAERQLRNR